MNLHPIHKGDVSLQPNTEVNDRAKLNNALNQRITRAAIILTVYAAFLNSILRSSEESVVTLYRVLLPFTLLLTITIFWRAAITRYLVYSLLITAAYSFCQLYFASKMTDPFCLSYTANILSLIAFIYLVTIWMSLCDYPSFLRHLYSWYLFLVLASIHQLITGFHYPNAPFLDGVARIFHGQENDTSLAIASFVPFLVSRLKKDFSSWIALLLGVGVIYINGTRCVLLAVAFYPALLLAGKMSRGFSRLSKLQASLTLAAVAILLGLIVYVERDAPVPMSDHVSSLQELLLEPIQQIISGYKPTEQLTSINLRVTLIGVGLDRYLGSYGFGIGPGVSTYFVREYYPDIATSMHVFIVQLLIECGWLFLGFLVVLFYTSKRRLGKHSTIVRILFLMLVTASITSGAITNYYFFACAIALLAHHEISRSNLFRRTAFDRALSKPRRILNSQSNAHLR